ncbi:MAG: DUF1841 family protein [Alphaproteobacteria bacterium]|nr:DUF1841 family protein [Alphaproteobacteria bacterium]MCB9691232.1 DUF1841 family protein [Alphaproteobacteria bacterium]
MSEVHDPDVAPDPAAWLALEESERMERMLAGHRGREDDALHKADVNHVMHAALHGVVETQIAAAEPPEVAAALARLCEAGLTRHAAIHGLMRVLLVHMAGMLDRSETFDRAGYVEAVAGLEAADVVAQGLRRMEPAEPLRGTAGREEARRQKRLSGSRPSRRDRRKSRE